MEDKNQESDLLSKRVTNEEKESTSLLRNEFLDVLFALSNNPVKIQFEKTKNQLDAIYTGCDFTFSTISVKDLETRIGKEPFSLLRANDIKSIDYKLE